MLDCWVTAGLWTIAALAIFACSAKSAREGTWCFFFLSFKIKTELGAWYLHLHLNTSPKRGAEAMQACSQRKRQQEVVQLLWPWKIDVISNITDWRVRTSLLCGKLQPCLMFVRSSNNCREWSCIIYLEENQLHTGTRSHQSGAESPELLGFLCRSPEGSSYCQCIELQNQ